MSISASIDIKIYSKSNTRISATNIINTLVDHGWELQRNNKITYISVGDDDLFDWKEQCTSEINILEIICQKEDLQEIIGVNIYWMNSDVGLSMLIFNNYEISFSLSINRVKIKLIETDITDVNWYLEKLAPCFSNDLLISKITFNQD